MAKKAIEEKHELIKFIKNLYSEEIQLNFDKYFSITYVGSNIFKLSFPSNNYYYLTGSLDLSACPSICNWMSGHEGYTITFNNAELDSLRKEKLTNFNNIRTDNDAYIIEMADGSHYSFSRHIDNDGDDVLPDFTQNISIPANMLDMSTLCIYRSDGLTFDKTDDIAFESAIKNFKVIFKKNAQYILSSTAKDSSGLSYIKLEGKGNLCTLEQYFRVI